MEKGGVDNCFFLDVVKQKTKTKKTG